MAYFLPSFSVALAVIGLSPAAHAGDANPSPPEARMDLEERSIPDRAKQIGRLQRGRTSSRDEAAIVDLFLHTSGLALTELKDRVDAGDDHRDLQQLVYHDIDDAELRRKLVAHLRGEAAKVRDRDGPQGVKILSDIDDTVYPNFADRRAWSLNGAPYPGIVAFYDALTGPAPPGRARLTLVSARPYERSGLLEGRSASKLRRMGLPPHAILSGDAWTLLSIAPGRAGERAIAEIGAEKLRNFEQWSELMGEYDFVISGDRSQADHVFAADALATDDSRVLAAFIHDVGDRPRRNAPQLFYNETVLGHALDALAGGFIDREGLSRVRDAVTAAHSAGVYPRELESAVARDLARADAAEVREPSEE